MKNTITPVRNYVTNDIEQVQVSVIYNYIDTCFKKVSKSGEIGDSVYIEHSKNFVSFYNSDSGQSLEITKINNSYSLISSNDNTPSHKYELTKDALSNNSDVYSMLWIGLWLDVQFKLFSGFYIH